MADPRRDPETGGRSLAEILREAGVESTTRTGRRRRWDDDDDTGIRQRGSESGEDRGTGRLAYGRRASDLPLTEPAGAAAEPSTAAIPGLRPSGKPGVPGAGSVPVGTGVLPDQRTGVRRTTEPGTGGRRAGDRPTENRPSGDRPAEARPAEARPADNRRTEDRRAGGRRGVEPRTDRRTDRRGAARTAAGAPAATGTRADRAPAAPPRIDDNPSTGPIPIVPDDVEDAAPEGPLAWLRFGGELVIALAAGVGIYFLFTVIWEILPYLAVLVAPLAVTGLVFGVGAYRHKVGRDPVGPKLLAVLVFAGTILTVTPAAGLLATG
jgi:hypothetical protein